MRSFKKRLMALLSCGALVVSMTVPAFGLEAEAESNVLTTETGLSQDVIELKEDNDLPPPNVMSSATPEPSVTLTESPTDTPDPGTTPADETLAPDTSVTPIVSPDFSPEQTAEASPAPTETTGVEISPPPEPEVSPSQTEIPMPAESIDPEATETPTEEPIDKDTPPETSFIFPEVIPEGYVEIEVFPIGGAMFVLDDEKAAGVEIDATVYAPEDAFSAPVLFVPQPLDDDGTDSIYELLIDAGYEFADIAALDLSFLGEDGEEQEPSNGPVYVQLTVPQPNIEMNKEECPRLYHITENGVEPVNVEARYDGDSIILGFAVESFSNFGLTWGTTVSKYQMQATYRDRTGTELTVSGGNSSTIKTNSSYGKGMRSSIKTPSGYAISHLELHNGNKTIPVYDVRVNRTGLSWNGYTYTWELQETSATDDWQEFSNNSATLSVVLSSDEENQRAVMVFINKSILSLNPDGTYSGVFNTNSAYWSNAIAPKITINGKNNYFTYLDEYETTTENGKTVPKIHKDVSDPNTGNTAYFITGTINNTDTSQKSDTNSRKLGTEEGFTLVTDDGEQVYRMQDFPTDEMVFEWLAANSSDNKNRIQDPSDPTGKTYLPVSEVTAEKYSIRWLSVKYNVADYWHLDGVLVGKEGHIVVSKTFYGAPDVIDNVICNTENPFYITVSEYDSVDDKGVPIDKEPLYKLYLDRAEVRASDGSGYVEKESAKPTKTIDENGNPIYTWVLDTKNVNYHIMEHNYTYYDEHISTVTEYRFSNLNEGDKEDKNEVWTQFVGDPSLTLTGRSYPSDMDTGDWQHVHFRNGYLPAKAIILHTLADNTKPLTGIEFKVYREGQEQKLYLMDGIYYLTAPKAEAEKITECETATVNENGTLIFGSIGDQYTKNASYTLVEAVRPNGYSEAALQFTITNDAEVIQTAEDKAASKASSGIEIVGEMGNNYSVSLNHVMANIDISASIVWNTDNVASSVDVTLYKNGVFTGHTVTLSTANGWKGNFGTFPAYDWAGEISYSVKQTVDGKDGETLYLVTIARTETMDEWDNISALHLTVTNSRSDKTGTFSFTKRDSDSYLPLSGAIFGLYTDKDCTARIATLSSDSDGVVKSETLPAYVYYLKEIYPPKRYLSSGIVYEIVIKDADSFSITSFSKDGAILDKDDEMVQWERELGTGYEILNDKDLSLTLPVTGGPGPIIYYMAGISLTLCGAYSIRRKKREDVQPS